MKKNVVESYINADKPNKKQIFKKEILPFFICLLVAAVIWLLVTNLNSKKTPDTEGNAEIPVTESVA